MRAVVLSLVLVLAALLVPRTARAEIGIGAEVGVDSQADGIVGARLTYDVPRTKLGFQLSGAAPSRGSFLVRGDVRWATGLTALRGYAFGGFATADNHGTGFGPELGIGGELRSVPGLGLFVEAGSRLFATSSGASFFAGGGLQLGFDDL